MPLLENFIFSANNLQNYVDCPRRFELKYLLKQGWPALVSQPVQKLEEKMAMGSEFHHLTHQFLEGLPAALLCQFITNVQVLEWFDHFTAFIPQFTKGAYFSEHTSYASIENFKTIAVFDFIAYSEEDKIIIIDWKTITKEPNQLFYQDQIQTKLYPVVAFDSLPYIFNIGPKISPSKLSLLYWFPAFPKKSFAFHLTLETYNESKRFLGSLMQEIAETPLGEFQRTDNLNRCRYCQYRSLCERGAEAAPLEKEDEFDLDNFIESMSFET